MVRSSTYSSIQLGNKDIFYQEYAPAMPLLPYIHCYWKVSGEMLTNQKIMFKVLPDGCIDMIFFKASFIRI